MCCLPLDGAVCLGRERERAVTGWMFVLPQDSYVEALTPTRDHWEVGLMRSWWWGHYGRISALIRRGRERALSFSLSFHVSTKKGSCTHREEAAICQPGSRPSPRSDLPAPWPGASQSLDLWEASSYCLRLRSIEFCYNSPNKQRGIEVQCSLLRLSLSPSLLTPLFLTLHKIGGWVCTFRIKRQETF